MKLQKLKRKKLEIILITVITFATVSSIKTNNEIRENKTIEEITQETTANPVSGKVVILDAGHGR